MTFYTHSFSGPVVTHDFGRVVYTVVYLPEELHDELPLEEFPRLRVEAEVNGFQLDGAFVPNKGRWYLMVAKRVLKATGLAVGDAAEVRFCVADQDAVDVPEELHNALVDNKAARAAWGQLTPGKRRGLAYRVSSAKRPETRLKRVAEVLVALSTG